MSKPFGYMKAGRSLIPYESHYMANPMEYPPIMSFAPPGMYSQLDECP